MKSYLYLCIGLLCFQAAFGQKSDKITLEQVAEKCKDAPAEQRMTIKVEKFSIKTNKCPDEFDGELKAMLTNALQKVNCFSVLESDSEAGGFSNQGGDNIDAQLIVTGEVTQYAEKKTKVFGFENNNVTVGFILKVLDSQNGKILFSESVNGQATAQGYSSKIFSSSNLTGAVAQAVEEAIIKAVEILADKKDKIEAPVIKPKVFDATNCAMISGGKGPKIMILIPEAQTLGGPIAEQQNKQSLERERVEAQKEQYRALGSLFRAAGQALSKNSQPQQQSPVNANAVKKSVVIEQAVSENIIIKKFIEAGFRVIDPKVYDKMRKQADSTSDDVSKMAALGLKMGAHIIITGYALSERVANQDGRFSFRGSIELRALTTEDATILASHTLQAGGNDAAESIASNKALRNASFKMADYMMEQLCKRNMTFAEASTAKTNNAAARVGGTSANTGSTITTTIAATNVNFIKLKALDDALRKNSKVKEIKRTLKEGNGSLIIEHTGSVDDLADYMSKITTPKIEITGVEGNQMTITMQ